MSYSNPNRNVHSSVGGDSKAFNDFRNAITRTFPHIAIARNVLYQYCGNHPDITETPSPALFTSVEGDLEEVRGVRALNRIEPDIPIYHLSYDTTYGYVNVGRMDSYGNIPAYGHHTPDSVARWLGDIHHCNQLCVDPTTISVDMSKLFEEIQRFSENSKRISALLHCPGPPVKHLDFDAVLIDTQTDTVKAVIEEHSNLKEDRDPQDPHGGLLPYTKKPVHMSKRWGDKWGVPTFMIRTLNPSAMGDADIWLHPPHKSAMIHRDTDYADYHDLLNRWCSQNLTSRQPVAL
jgi:hypothetical protein